MAETSFDIKNESIDENNEGRRIDSEVVFYPRFSDQKGEEYGAYRIRFVLLLCAYVCVFVGGTYSNYDMDHAKGR